MNPALVEAAKTALRLAGAAFKEADENVAKLAEERGISKEEAWDLVGAASWEINKARGESILDVFDPKGWRAAARAIEDAKQTGNAEK